jgi:heat shock protein HslJ
MLGNYFGTVVVLRYQNVSMKKTIFVLPLCVFLAFCSSSRKAVTPAGPGISNVNVSRNDTMTSAAAASASFTAADRDWAYKASRDTILNGTWTLDGMMAADGNWSSTQTQAAAAQDSALGITDSSLMMDTSMMGTPTASAGRKGKKAKSKTNRRALYDAAQTRLKMNFKDTTIRDTTIQPYQYWKRTPSLTINAARQVFTGNTGCNSLSGSFNFSDKEIQFGRNMVTSKMACNEYDESVFISALKKADSYTLNGNTLEIKQGDTLLLTFRKS